MNLYRLIGMDENMSSRLWLQEKRETDDRILDLSEKKSGSFSITYWFNMVYFNLLFHTAKFHYFAICIKKINDNICVRM